MRSSAACQRSTEPLHMIGATPTNITSAANTTRGVGHVHDRVARGVRRPDLDHLDLAPAHVELEGALEGARRRAQLDALEVERLEQRGERAEARRPARPRAASGARARARDRRCRPRGAASARARGSSPAMSSAHALRADHLGAGEQLVAPAVVAVGVGVDRSGGSAPARSRAHLREHRVPSAAGPRGCRRAAIRPPRARGRRLTRRARRWAAATPTRPRRAPAGRRA